MKYYPLLLAAALMAGASTVSTTGRDKKSDNPQEIFLADPTIFAENGKFYVSGTGAAPERPFHMLESTDLTHWAQLPDNAAHLSKGGATFGTDGFWAPQIIRHGNGYLMAYTANEQTALAHADSLTGLYTGIPDSPIDASEKNIDPFLFHDDDGKWYLYHVRFNHGNFIWVGEFDINTGKIIDGTLRRCFANTQPWEATPAYDSDPIMEGPTVIKLDGTYYLFYSANHFMSMDYAVGYATAPSPLGPWTKNPANPIINRTLVGERGSGHGDVFSDNEGNLRYVYHVHNSDTRVSPRRTRIITLSVTKGENGVPATITADPSTIIKPIVTK